MCKRNDDHRKLVFYVEILTYTAMHFVHEHSSHLINRENISYEIRVVWSVYGELKQFFSELAFSLIIYSLVVFE